jgi:hypothetical protein
MNHGHSYLQQAGRFEFMIGRANVVRAIPALLPQLGHAEAGALDHVIGSTPIALHMRIDQRPSFHLKHD